MDKILVKIEVGFAIALCMLWPQAYGVNQGVMVVNPVLDAVVSFAYELCGYALTLLAAFRGILQL